MTSLHTKTIEIVHVHCNGCGVDYGLERGYLNDHEETRATFHCPNGCRRAFTQSTADLLRKRLAREEAQHDQTRADRDHKEAQRRAEKAAKTKLKKRVAAGVCPCCKRSFENLARHMKGQHPEYVSDD